MFFHEIPSLIPKLSPHYCEEGLELWSTSSVQLVSVPDTQHRDGTTVQHTASNTK